MAVLTTYKVSSYKEDYKKIFAGIYNDFKNCAAEDYNFELEPLSYEKFTKSIDDGLLNCLILFEDNIPTGFLVYTTIISESLELNIIHCIGNENINQKRKLLLEKFLEITKPITREKVVTYPMLGKQSSFVDEIKNFGFKTVNTSVMGFKLSDLKAADKLKSCETKSLPKDYAITDWKMLYMKDAAEIIHQAFKHSSDGLFDSRFLSTKGCRDIIEKITENVYGEFLPEITKVLTYKKKPVGICFANMTNDKIANIPLVGILKHHRNQGFGKLLLKSLTESLISVSLTTGREISEINASCDSDSISAVSMYEAVGFTSEYSYAQAYLPKH